MRRPVTLQYCIDTNEIEGRIVIINDGKVIGFQEEIPTQTANQGVDNK